MGNETKTTLVLPKELVGAKVIKVGADDQGFPFIHFSNKKANKSWSVYFSSDEEQNSPGIPIVIY